MKRKVQFFFFFFASIIIVTIMQSCNSVDKNTESNQDRYKNLVERSDKFLKTNPDSAIYYADSVIQFLLKNGITDSTLIAMMGIKAQSWLNKGHSDSAINILLRARTMAIEASDTLAQANSSFKLGEVLADREDYNSAEKYIKEAILLFELHKKEYKLAAAYHLFGTLLISKGDNMKAQEYLMKATAVFKHLDSFNALGVIYIAIARNNNAMGNKDEAAKYYKLAISQLAEAHDTSNLGIAYINMGVMLRTTNPDSALALYRKAIALLAASDSSQPPIVEKYNIANLYLDQKQYSKALEEYDEVLELCKSYNLAGGIARVYSGYASVYEETGKRSLATSYLTKAVRIADSIGDVSLGLKLRQSLMDNYRKQHNYDAAMLINDTIKIIHDTLTTGGNKTIMRTMEQLHEAENKELENSILKKELKNQADQTIYRQVIFTILALALVLMFYLYRKISRLYVERTKAYHTLISKYKQESELLSRLRSIKTTEILPGTESQTAKNDILEQLIEYYVTEKPYLDPKLKVADVAEKLNCSRKAIALALKEYKDSNFNTFTNRFRVDMAIAMMDNPTFSNYKIEAIAYDSGFGSKSNFYDKFESCTGVKFNYYRRYHTTQSPDDSNDE
jgi:tetratricopeptide (TPR) repeat protein